MYELFANNPLSIEPILFLVLCSLIGWICSKRCNDWAPIECLIPIVMITVGCLILYKSMGIQVSLFVCELGAISSLWGIGYARDW